MLISCLDDLKTSPIYRLIFLVYFEKYNFYGQFYHFFMDGVLSFKKMTPEYIRVTSKWSKFVKVLKLRVSH